MRRRSMRKVERLENQYFDLEKDTHYEDEDLNDENVEEKTLNYATKVAKSKELIKKAAREKNIKCFNIDTKICKNISSFSKTLTQFVRTETKIFNPKLFAEKLITHYNPSARVELDNQSEDEEEENSNRNRLNGHLDLEDFKNLGKEFSNLINELPILNFAYGSFTPDINEKALAKERKQRIKRTDFTTGETVKPKDYEEVNRDDTDVMTKEIDLLLKKIDKKTKNSRNGKIEYFDSVIDSDCLTSTVTNIFHSAFMVKECMLNIEFKNGKNLVKPVDEEETKNPQNLDRKQQVLRFNKSMFDNWRRQRNEF